MKSLEEYKAFIAKVRKNTGIDSFVSDEDGLVSLSVDDKFNVNFQYITGTRRFLCFVEVCTLDRNAPRAVYRELLVGALFGKDTAGGYFTIDPSTETLIYNYFFDGDDVEEDIEGFVQTIEQIMQLCEMWIERVNAFEDNEKNAEKMENLNNIVNMF
jgi:hypothetical protein